LLRGVDARVANKVDLSDGGWLRQLHQARPQVAVKRPEQETHLAEPDEHKQEAHDADLDPRPDVADRVGGRVRVVGREQGRAVVDSGRVLGCRDDDDGEGAQDGGAHEDAIDPEAENAKVLVNVPIVRYTMNHGRGTHNPLKRRGRSR
jgi:hypothetical protein